MTDLEALVALNLIPDIGSIRLKKLLEYFGTPQAILGAPVEKLTRVAGIGDKIAGRLCRFDHRDLTREFQLIREHGLRVITPHDSEYPCNLRQIYDPPPVLYVKGTLLQEDECAVAIVGSRRASCYGLACAEGFARELAGQGVTIVSGMARGIDTAAHRGALAAGGRTIAVIGSGFNHLYPPENRALADQIAAHGAVVSEFPVDSQPLKQHFPRRNRLISGLSLGVLVAEAARNSGALITADCALEQGREVFALPGQVTSGTSFGTNALIKQGALLVSSAGEILAELGPRMTPPASSSPLASPAPVDPCLLAGEEALLYGALSNEPAAFDELREKTDLDVGRISAILLKLRLAHLVSELPGRVFIRSGSEKPD